MTLYLTPLSGRNEWRDLTELITITLLRGLGRLVESRVLDSRTEKDESH